MDEADRGKQRATRLMKAANKFIEAYKLRNFSQ